MKKALLFIPILLIASMTAMAQWQPPLLYGKKESRLAVGKVFMFPTGCGNPTTLVAADSAINQAGKYFDSCAHRLWIYDPKLKAWDSLHLGPAGSGSALTFNSPLNESGGIVDLGGLSGYGTSGQMIRSTGTGLEYFSPTFIVPGDTAAIANRGWRDNGNTGTTPVNNWLGTNDSTGWLIKVNGYNSGYIHNSGVTSGVAIRYTGSFTAFGQWSGNTLINRINAGLETGGHLNTLYGAGTGPYIGAQYDTTRAASNQNNMFGIGAGHWVQGTSFVTGTGRNTLNGESSCYFCLTPGENVGDGVFTLEAGFRPTKNTAVGSNALRTGNDAVGMTSIGAYASHYTGCSISGTTITSGGSGYTTATVTFSAPFNTGSPGVCYSVATGTAIISGGAIVGIEITNPGCGYITISGHYYTGADNLRPIVTITGDGTGATADVIVTCGDNSTSLGHVAGWMSRAPKNMIYVGSGSEPANRYFDQYGGAFGTGAGIHSSLSSVLKTSNAWAFFTNAKVGADRTAAFGAALPDTALTFVFNKHVGDSLYGLNVYEGGAHIQKGLRAANITSNQLNPEGANNIVVKKSTGSENFSIRNTGGIVFKDHIYGLDKIDIGKDSAQYMAITHRFGQGENNYHATPLTITINEDSAYKKSRGNAITINHTMGWKDLVATNPSAIDGAEISALRDLSPRKGDYSFFVSTSFPTASIYAAQRFRTESSTDSLAKFTFYGGVGSEAAPSSFRSYVTNNHGKQSDVYGMVNGYTSAFGGSTQAGRYFQHFNHYSVSQTVNMTAGKTGTVSGLYIESIKTDSINRAWGVLQLGVNDRNAFRGKLMVGDTTHAAADSSFIVKGNNGARFERGMNAPNLPVGKQALQLYVDASGTFYVDDTTGAGGGGGGSGTVNTGAANKAAYYPGAGTTVDDVAGAEFNGTNKILQLISQAATDVPFTITGHASQSADLFVAENSAGTDLTWITPLGRINSVQNINAFNGQTESVQIGYVDGSAGIEFGASSDTKIRKTAANELSFYNGTNYGKLKLGIGLFGDGTYGSGGTPSISFINDPTTGFALNSTSLVLTNQNQALIQFNTAAARIKSGVQVNWSSGDPTTTGATVGLVDLSSGVLKATDGSTGWGIFTSKHDRFGTGSPEGALSAEIGTIYHRTDGGTGTSLYIKESGSGNTGWVAVAAGGSGLGDPGGNGIVVRTALNTTTNRTLTDGVGIGWTNGTGVSGNPVADIKGYNIWDNATLATTSTSTATIGTITPDDNTRGTAVITLVGIESADQTKGLTGKKFVHWKKISGTVTVLAVIDEQADYLETWTTTAWTVDASGGDLRIRVTPETTNSCDWSAQYAVKFVTYQF